MKISYLKIYDFNQFQNFTLDLTYPVGHEKEGKPLDKVCFIGQSGTGKTTLLEIVGRFVNDDRHLELIDQEHILSKRISAIVQNNGKDIASFLSTNSNNLINLFLKKYNHRIDNYKLIHIPSDFWGFSKPEVPIESLKTSLLKTESEINKEIAEINKEIAKMKIFDFREENFSPILRAISFKIRKYQNERADHTTKTMSRLLGKSGEKRDDILKEFEAWEKANPDPLEKLASFINPLINKFQLEVEIDPDARSVSEGAYIKIKSLSGKPVPHAGWSSGTRRVIDCSLAIHELATENMVVLMDEPENSLYPDIQRILVPHYTKLAPQAQFFFATHSPIIASAFEPWEIVELKFNDEGFVYQEPYFEGERHVDDYTIDPRYLEWQDVLRYVFDVPMVNSDERRKALNRFSELGNKLRNGISDEERAALQVEYERLGEKLKWKKA